MATPPSGHGLPEDAEDLRRGLIPVLDLEAGLSDSLTARSSHENAPGAAEIPCEDGR